MSFTSISRFAFRRIYPVRVSFSQSVGVSSLTGDGVAEFFEAVEASREEYEKSVPPTLSPSWALLIDSALYAQGVSS
jgi:hypothetical protein